MDEKSLPWDRAALLADVVGVAGLALLIMNKLS